MKHYITAAVLAASMALSVEKADAASLDLMTLAPTLSSSTAVVDYVEVAPDGDLSAFGAEVDFTDGVFPNGLTEIGFGIGFSIADPTMDLTGGFGVFDDGGLFLGGDLFAVGFTEGVVELQFNNLDGSSSGSFGTSVLMEIVFGDVLASSTNPFSAFVDGESYNPSITISNVAPIPLPGGLLLLLGGLGSIALLKLRRNV